VQSEWFLAFVLNVKNCFNAKKETFSSVYLLITEIYTYLSYGDGIAEGLEKATAARWNPYFMFTIIFLHKITVMNDDTFGGDTCLALCQHVNFKGL